MKGLAIEAGRYREDPKIPCGATGYEFSSIPRKPRLFCGRWECDKCLKYKVEEYKKVLWSAGLSATAYMSKRPPVTTSKERNAFTNFLRKIEKPFFWFKSHKRLILVTKYIHPNAKLKPTYYIIEELFPEVLSESWIWWAGNRFGKSRKKQIKQSEGLEGTNDIQDAENIQGDDDIKSIKPFINKHYARWKKYNDPKGEVAYKEWKILQDEFEKYKFLKKYSNELYLDEDGEELIKHYKTSYCGAEVSAAGIQCQCSI